MHSENFRRRALLATLGLLVLTGISFAALRTPVHHEKRGALYCVEEAGFLYTFDAAWRTETLFQDNDGDGIRTPVDQPDPARLARLRGELLRHLDVRDLHEVPTEGAGELEAIRALGYI